MGYEDRRANWTIWARPGIEVLGPPRDAQGNRVSIFGDPGKPKRLFGDPDKALSIFTPVSIAGRPEPKKPGNRVCSCGINSQDANRLCHESDCPFKG